ncbi:MAG: serine/threonine protein kinase [Myxococcaceae bacterium]|nr:serine/threonine protein kinase [Myxococcaceae bacterium]
MAEVLATDDADAEGHALRTFSELRRGARLGRYELLVPIATGGMARVWAARQHGQRGFTKLVAIKTILPHLAREPEFERMFLDEARIASLVHHPNVAEIYELGEESFGPRGSVLYLAMEWVNGDSLMHVLRSGVAGSGPAKIEPIDLRVAVRIVADAAAGLHAAHELKDDDGASLGVVHRDVSPHNLLISADGHVKVADFGVAKALGGMQSQTAAGQIKGKISYMAPEQVTGAAVDRTSDVFALGCVLYEATTGAPPFRGEGDHQVMHALLSGKFVMPSKALIGFPFELENILCRALSSRQADRFPTAEKMRIALEEWLASTGGMVTSTHVAATVRARIGTVIDTRKEKIRAASAASADADVGSTSMSTSMGAMGATPAPSPSAPDVGYGSSSGIQRMPGNATRVGPPVPYQGYDPRQSMTGAPSQTLPLPSMQGYDPRATYNTRGVALANAVGQEGGYDPRLSQLTPTSGPVSSPQTTALAALLEGPQRYLVAAALGVATAVVIGLFVILVVHLTRGKAADPEPIAPTTTATTTTTAHPDPIATQAPTALPRATATVSATAMPTATVAEASNIAVHTVPAQVTLTIDGTRLPAGATDVPRPAAGKTSVLRVTADGYHEETRKLDEHSPPTLDIALIKKPPAATTTQRPSRLPANPF